MADNKKVNLSINTPALLGNYLADIQNLLDIITFAHIGQQFVDEKNYQNHISFMTFHPASNRRLSFHDVKDKSSQWLLTSFLTDSINSTGVFLDECRKICALFRLSGKGKVSGQELNNIFQQEWKKYHELGFPAKFKHLRDEFTVETPFEGHFLSLNQARNCLVHRKGIVSNKDINENGKLVIKWRIMELVVTSPDGKEEVVIESPRIIESGGSLGYRLRDRERDFEVGQKITLELTELYQNIITLYSFATELVKSIESYGKAQGVLK